MGGEEGSLQQWEPRDEGSSCWGSIRRRGCGGQQATVAVKQQQQALGQLESVERGRKSLREGGREGD
eukprot:682629-Rhodomonas_salina.2